MKYYVYILHSQQIDTYYTGYTGDPLEERLRKHNTNHKGYTGKTNDWKYVYLEVFQTKKEAIEIEKYIKSRKSRTYIEQLVKNRDRASHF